MRHFVLTLIGLLFVCVGNLQAQSVEISGAVFELGMTKDRASSACFHGNLALILKARDQDLVEDKDYSIAYGKLTFDHDKLVKIEKYLIPIQLVFPDRAIQSAEVLSLAFYQATTSITDASACRPSTVSENNPRFTRRVASITCSYQGYERTIYLESKTVHIGRPRNVQFLVEEELAIGNEDSQRQ